jgi:hypothetical protein
MAITGLTASPTSGDAGRTTVVVTIPENKSRTFRQQALTATGNKDGKTATTYANQHGSAGFRVVTAWKIGGVAQAAPTGGNNGGGSPLINTGSIGIGGGAIEITGSSNLGALIRSLEFSKAMGNPSIIANGSEIVSGSVINPVPGDPGKTAPYTFKVTFQVPANAGAQRVLRIIMRKTTIDEGAEVVNGGIVASPTKGTDGNIPTIPAVAAKSFSTVTIPTNEPGTPVIATPGTPGTPGTDPGFTLAPDAAVPPAKFNDLENLEYCFNITQAGITTSIAVNKFQLNGFPAAGGSGSFDVVAEGESWTRSGGGS